ncbi:5-formyltetrahydrofolate cyclo-ligase [Veillonella magna]|uniref:5-formyltetrahydrofolate cyclo-ligase n=1 Tax=Veillonella magna TaxID=464322 RepID=UPI0004248A66|nr:5-formyltetrahydrofolate cyclo-ligase [Veillonella magna]
MDKKGLRLAMKARRQALSEEECKQWAVDLGERITASSYFHKATRIMAYLAMPKEANLDTVIERAIAAGKEVYVPVCVTSTDMVAAHLQSLDDVERGVLNIRIPRPGYTMCAPEDLDLILVPGVAFDEKGGRMGMGAGYYDRFLAKATKARCVGVCWDMQVLADAIPMEAHDCPVDALITNIRTICREP